MTIRWQKQWITGLLTLAATPLFGQGWSRGYEITTDLLPRSATPRADGGAVCAGMVGMAYGAGLLEVDAGGNRQHARDYPGVSQEISFYEVIELDNGDLLTSGWNSRIGSAFLARIHWSGAFVWGREIDQIYFAPRKLVRLDDGDYLIAGYDREDSDANFAAIRFSEHGAILWQQSYGGPLDEILTGACSDGANGAVLCGVRKSSDDEGWILRIGPSGYASSQRRITASHPLSAEGIVRRSDGTYFIAGIEPSQAGIDRAWIARYDNTLRPIWAKQFGRGIHTEVGDIALASDEGALVVGHDRENATGIWMAKLDPQGTVQWQREYQPRHIEQRVRAQDVDVYPNGNILILAQNITEHGTGQPWMLRLDREGKIGVACHRESNVSYSTFETTQTIRLTEMYAQSLPLNWSAFSSGFSPLDVEEWTACTSVYAPWTNEGRGLPGSQGIPDLAGAGLLEVGRDAMVIMSGTRPFALGYLVLGFSRVDHPFAGGTLVPAPDFVVGEFSLGLAGELYVATEIPSSIPSGVHFYLQGLVLDTSAPQGIALSNAIHTITP